MNTLLRINGAFDYSVLELFLIGVLIALATYVLFRLLGK